MYTPPLPAAYVIDTNYVHLSSLNYIQVVYCSPIALLDTQVICFNSSQNRPL